MPEPQPVIDSHQHLWTRAQVPVAWIERGSPFDRDFTASDYAKEVAGQGVTAAVYVEVDVAPGLKVREAEFVLALIDGGKSLTKAAILGVRPADAGLGAYLDRFKGRPAVVGFRQVLASPEFTGGYCTKPEFVAGVRLIGERGFGFDLCGPATELPAFLKLVKACPGTKFTLDHCGNPRADFAPDEQRAWADSVAKLAECPNVVCKFSGFVVNGEKPFDADAIRKVVDEVLGRFGATRAMFGGDWPVVTRSRPLGDWLAAARQALGHRAPAEQAGVLHDTAKAYYRLT